MNIHDEGAWITLFFIPSMISLFVFVRRHYHWVRMHTICKVPVDVPGLSQPPIAVVAIDRWNSITRQGIDFAARLSPEVIGLHVEPGKYSILLQDEWKHCVEESFRAAGKEPPQLHVLPSPYRFIIIPIVQFILDLSENNPTRNIVVVIPELVEDKWYGYFLHNQRGHFLEWVLLVRGNEHIFTVSAPGTFASEIELRGFAPLWLYLLRFQQQILIIKAKICQRRNGRHPRAFNGAVRLQGESHKCVFDRAIAPMRFERVVLPML